jgi:RNase H-fold protein (predicted Holliday junction resolvase)
LAQEDNTSLKEALSQEGKERKIAQQKVEEMEKQISGVFQAIPDNAESEEASSEEKMRKIAQALAQYKEKIKELEEHASTYYSSSSLSAKRERRDNSCRKHCAKHT